jgi:hypothetical protein
MTTPKATPPDVDMEILAYLLAELRDALVRTALDLRDYQFTLDSDARCQARDQADQWIEWVQGGESRSQNGLLRHRPGSV